jgi:tetratricopeptide (TPR) repeat protein
MPKIDLELSLSTAGSHLFRHVGNVRELKRNPLVQRYLLLGRLSDSTDVDVLNVVRDRLLAAARACRAADIASGRRLDAARCLPIVAGIVSGKPVARVMSELGISRRQYYRERRAVCDRIVTILTTPLASASATVGDDRLHLQIRRASSLIAQGVAARARALMEDAAVSGPPGALKVEALLTLSRALVALDDFAGAARSVRSANALIDRVADREGRVMLHDRALFADAIIADESGAGESALAIMDDLFERRCVRNEPGRIPTEFDLDVALEAGFSRFNWQSNTNLSGIEEALHHVHRLSRVVAHITGRQQVEHAMLAAAAVDRNEGGRREQYVRYAAALDLSIVHGVADATVHLSLWLAAQAVMERRFAETRLQCRRAIDIAHTIDGRQPKLAAALHGAGMLFATPYWELVEGILNEVQYLPRTGSDDWVALTELRGRLCLRMGRWDEALSLLTDAHAGASAGQNKRRQASAALALGSALHALGKRHEAGFQIRRAVGLADAYGTSWSRFQAHRAADHLLENPQAQQQA